MNKTTKLDSNRILRVETISISSLQEDPRNARKHSPQNLEAIKKSLERFEQQIPIVIGEDGVVIAGNGRLQVMKDLGYQTVQAIVTDLTEEESSAFAIADNRTAELADWDYQMLGSVFSSLPEELQRSTGFSDADIQNFSSAAWDIIADSSPENVSSDIEAPVLNKSSHTVTFTADQWETISSYIMGYIEDSEDIPVFGPEIITDLCTEYLGD